MTNRHKRRASAPFFISSLILYAVVQLHLPTFLSAFPHSYSLHIFLLIATLSDCSELIESGQLFFAETAKILHSTYFPFILRYFCVNIGTFPLELLNNCCTLRPAIQLIICIRHWQGELIRNGREPDFSPSRGKQSF